MNIWKSLDSFREESSIGTWVYRVAVNTALGLSAKEIRRLKLFASADPEGLIRWIGSDPDQTIGHDDKFDLLETCMNELSVIEKLLITLVLESLSTREIAEIIGITETNVRVKLHRIKEELKQKILTRYESGDRFNRNFCR
jgi:RNA polymerase sigma-70 factor (ECF subfamily)